MPGYESLSGAARRRLLRRALLRPTIGSTGLFVLYFSLPLDRTFDVLTVVGLLVGLMIFAALIVFQARAIMRSPYPRLTAVTALAVSIPLFVLAFATVYYLMDRTTSAAFTEPMTRLDSLYFTVTMVTTVGFGDIAARSEAARAVATVQMVGDLVLFGLVVRVLLNAVQTGLATRAGSATDASAGRPNSNGD